MPGVNPLRDMIYKYREQLTTWAPRKEHNVLQQPISSEQFAQTNLFEYKKGSKAY
jgi:hypothetical protein